jgi:hypothetical protein
MGESTMFRNVLGLALVLVAAQICAAQGVCVNGQCFNGGAAGVYAGEGFPGGYGYGGYGEQPYAPRICFTFESAGGYYYPPPRVCFELPVQSVPAVYGGGYLPQQQFLPAVSPGNFAAYPRPAVRQRLVVRYRTR